MLKCFAFLLYLLSNSLLAQVTYEESRQASITVGKWLSKSTGHYDFLSATPVATKRGGEHFSIVGSPNIQTASDYGISYTQVPRDNNVTSAYQVLGFDTSDFSHTIDLTRFQLSLGFNHKHDFTFSYLTSTDGISGWGVGYKRVLLDYRHFFFSYRAQYARSKLDAYFDNMSITNDLSASLHFQLIDIYSGVRHSMGRLNFDSSIPQLSLPQVNFFSKLSELEYFYGVVLSTSLNSRLTFQLNQIGEEYSLAGKFSLHFDSLLPTINGWFRDPRYIKQW